MRRRCALRLLALSRVATSLARSACFAHLHRHKLWRDSLVMLPATAGLRAICKPGPMRRCASEL